MLRKLLACLALLTGLAASGAPAQAAVAVASRVEMAAAESAVSRDQAPATPARRASPRKSVSPGGTGPFLRTILRVPTIQLSSDRARE